MYLSLFVRLINWWTSDQHFDHHYQLTSTVITKLSLQWLFSINPANVSVVLYVLAIKSPQHDVWASLISYKHRTFANNNTAAFHFVFLCLWWSWCIDWHGRDRSASSRMCMFLSLPPSLNAHLALIIIKESCFSWKQTTGRRLNKSNHVSSCFIVPLSSILQMLQQLEVLNGWVL